MKRKEHICTLNLSAPSREPTAEAVCPARKRLAKGFARLEKIERERAQGRDWIFSRFAEHRIIWRELLQLELQDTDEQIERICSAVGIGSRSLFTGYTEEHHG
jgi:hypothetical protein